MLRSSKPECSKNVCNRQMCMWSMNCLRGQVNKFDLVVFIVAALAVMFAGVEIGLAISIGLSIALALWKSAFPHTAVLGQLPDTTVYRCVPHLRQG